MTKEENAINSLKYLKWHENCEGAIDIAINSIEILRCLECKLRHEINTEKVAVENVVDTQDYLHGLKRALSLIETLNKELSTNS